MRSGFWRESTEANNWGACKTRNPRSACLWPGELAQSAVGANSVASRAYVARLPPRCWSIRGARAAREEARAGARGDHLGRLGPLAWSSRRAIPWGGARNATAWKTVACQPGGNVASAGGASASPANGLRRCCWNASTSRWPCLHRGWSTVRDAWPWRCAEETSIPRWALPPARWQHGSARALRQRGQALRSGLSQHLGCCTQRCRAAGEPRAVGLGELREILFAV